MSSYLFTSELLWSRQVVAVVVSQVVVADNTCWLDASTDQEIDQHRLQLRLSGFEVVASCDANTRTTSVYDRCSE